MLLNDRLATQDQGREWAKAIGSVCHLQKVKTSGRVKPEGWTAGICRGAFGEVQPLIDEQL